MTSVTLSLSLSFSFHALRPKKRLLLRRVRIVKWVSMKRPLHPLKSSPARTKETSPVCLHPLVSKHLLYLPLLLVSMCVIAPGRQSMCLVVLLRKLLRHRMASLNSHHAVRIIQVTCDVHHRLTLLLVQIRRRLAEDLTLDIVKRPS